MINFFPGSIPMLSLPRSGFLIVVESNSKELRTFRGKSRHVKKANTSVAFFNPEKVDLLCMLSDVTFRLINNATPKMDNAEMFRFRFIACRPRPHSRSSPGVLVEKVAKQLENAGKTLVLITAR